MCWSFSFSNSLSNEYSELISFRINWFDLLAVQGTQESSPAPQFKSINSLVLSLHYGSTLTSVHDYWKNHSFDYMDLCFQNDVWGNIKAERWLWPQSFPTKLLNKQKQNKTAKTITLNRTEKKKRDQIDSLLSSLWFYNLLELVKTTKLF